MSNPHWKSLQSSKLRFMGTFTKEGSIFNCYFDFAQQQVYVRFCNNAEYTFDLSDVNITYRKIQNDIRLEEYYSCPERAAFEAYKVFVGEQVELNFNSTICPKCKAEVKERELFNSRFVGCLC